MCDKSVDLIEILRQNKSINMSTIVSLINYGFDSNDSLIALDFGLDFPQMLDISSEQKSVLKRVLTEYRLDLSLDLKTFMESINKINERNRRVTEEEYEEPEESNDEEVNPYLRKYYENELKSRELRENELKNEIKVLNKKLESIEKSFKRLLNGNRNELKELKNSLINAKNERIVENIRTKDKSFVSNIKTFEEVVKHSTGSDVRVENRKEMSSKSEDMSGSEDEDNREVKEELNALNEREEVLSEDKLKSNEIKVVLNSEKVNELVIKVKNGFNCGFGNCGKSFSRLYHAKTHIRRHLNLRLNCNYKKCKYYFYALSYLRIHLLKVHKKKFQFKCSECENSFLTNPLLVTHMRRHTIPKPFKCTKSKCNQSFPNNFRLNRHILRVHKKVKSFECNECEKKFFENCELIYHLNTEHN